ncbi:MAG: hypothetical protein ACK55Z_17970, partial [bacterium]
MCQECGMAAPALVGTQISRPTGAQLPCCPGHKHPRRRKLCYRRCRPSLSGTHQPRWRVEGGECLQTLCRAGCVVVCTVPRGDGSGGWECDGDAVAVRCCQGPG